MDVRYFDAGIELCVRDGGCGGSAGALVGGAGHGLAGMRERVRALGGELHAGRCDDGGFEVRASIPLSGAREVEHVGA